MKTFKKSFKLSSQLNFQMFIKGKLNLKIVLDFQLINYF